MKLGETLRRLRKNRKLTLVKASKGIGLSVSFLSYLEREKTRPSQESLEKLAEYYRVDINQLIEYTDHEAKSLKEKILPPGFQALLDEIPDVDEEMQDLLLRVEHRSKRRWQNNWEQLYYSLKMILEG